VGAGHDEFTLVVVNARLGGGCAGIRRKSRGTRGSRTPPFLRFLEFAFAPRVMVIGSGLLMMGYAFLGPKDQHDTGDIMVPAWFNPQ
jgi:hypothetical protein